MINPLAIAHVFRYILEALIIFLGVLPETGPWTALLCVMLTAEVEYNFAKEHPRHFRRL